MNADMILDAAFLQVEMQKLNSVKDQLVEMADLQAYNNLLTSVATFIHNHASKDEIPTDPLAFMSAAFDSLQTSVTGYRSQVENKFLRFANILDVDGDGQLTQIDYLPSAAITAESVNALDNQTKQICERFEVYVNEVSNQLNDQHSWDGKTTSLTTQRELTINRYMNNQASLEKLYSVITHLNHSIDLGSVAEYTQLSLKSGPIVRGFQDYISNVRKAITFHKDHFSYHHEQLASISSQIDLHMAITATSNFQKLTEKGQYGELPYKVVQDKLAQYQKPVLQMRQRTEELDNQLSEINREASRLKLTEVFLGSVFSKLQDRLDTIRPAVESIQQFKPPYLKQLQDTEFFTLFNDVQQTSCAKLSARINSVRTKLDAVYKSSAIKLIGGLIGTAVVVIGLAVFLFWE